MLCRLVAVLEFNTQSRNMKAILVTFYGHVAENLPENKYYTWKLTTVLMICAPKTNPFDGNCHRRVPWAATITVAFECDPELDHEIVDDNSNRSFPKVKSHIFFQ
jgi:hypothetical protein